MIRFQMDWQALDKPLKQLDNQVHQSWNQADQTWAALDQETQLWENVPPDWSFLRQEVRDLSEGLNQSLRAHRRVRDEAVREKGAWRRQLTWLGFKLKLLRLQNLFCNYVAWLTQVSLQRGRSFVRWFFRKD